MRAIQMNYPFVDKLIDAKVGLTGKDFKRNTRSHLAARQGSVVLVGKLWHFLGVNDSNLKGKTSLHKAIKAGKAEVVAALIATQLARIVLLRVPFRVTPLAFARFVEN